MKKVYWLNVLATTVFIAAGLAFWIFLFYMNLFFDPNKQNVSFVDKEEIVLNVNVLASEKTLYKTDNTIALLAPVRYEVVQAVYGDNCWYNLTDSWIYGSDKDVMTVNTTAENTYRIDCQELIGGKMTSKSITVIVVPQTEIRAAVLSQ